MFSEERLCLDREDGPGQTDVIASQHSGLTMRRRIDLDQNIISQQAEWIPGVDWIAGMAGAITIAVLLWAAVASA